MHAAERRALDLADKVTVLEKQLAAEQRGRQEDKEKAAEEARSMARAAAEEVRGRCQGCGATTRTRACAARVWW